MELPHPGGQIRIDVPPRIHIQGNNHTLRLPSFYVPDPLERRGRDYRNYRFTAEDERRLSYARSVDLSAEIGLQCGLERVCEVINRNSKKLHTVRLLPDPSGRVSTIIPINARTLVVFGAINRLAILQQSQPEHVAALNITPPPSVERVVYNFNSFHGISRFFLPEIDIKEGSAVRDAVICCWGWDGPPMWESNMDGDELEIARERWDDLRMLVARLRGIDVRVTFVDLHIIPPIYWGYIGTNTSTNVDEVDGDTPDKVDIEQVLRDTLVTKTNPRPINKNSNRARKKIPKSNLYEQKGELRFITSDEYKAELERNGEPESWMLHTTQIIEAKTPGYVDPTVATEKVYPSREAAQSMFPNFNFAAFNLSGAYMSCGSGRV